MNQNRILPLVGPALLVYLLADVLREGGGIDAVGVAVALVALFAVVCPFWLSRRLPFDEPGVRRVGALCTMSGLALVTQAGAGMSSLAVSIAGAAFTAAVGVLVLDLALVVPEEPRSLARARPSAYALAFVCGTLGALSQLPAIDFRGDLYILPSSVFAHAPVAFALFALVLAAVIRVGRARTQAGAFAASNAWGLIGIMPVIGLATLVVLGRATHVLGASSPWARIGSATGLVFVLYGHIALVDADRRIEAARATRSALAWALTVVATATLVGAIARFLPRDAITAGVSAAGVVAFANLVRRLLAPLIRRLLAPFGGRLLDALERIRVRMDTASTLEGLASAVLPPLRDASGDETASPVLYLVEPALGLRIDAAGLARASTEQMSNEVLSSLGERLGEIIVFADLDAQVVRRPEVRPLHEVLTRLDALCVVPLVVEGNLEGALVVPSGTRRMPPALEELTALLDVASAVAVRMAVFGEALRARDRLTRVAAEHDRVEQRLDATLEENDRLREEAKAMRAGRGWGGVAETVVAYAQSSRTLERRIADVAPNDAPVLLVAEPGSHVDRVGRRIHRASGRGEGPFVLGDCAALPQEELEAALFGSEPSQTGWLRLAQGGSLLLTDFPALPIPVQRALAGALATRSASPVGGSTSYAVDVRVIATARASLGMLVERSAADEDFARWLGQIEIDVPPLRDRREDLPSLVLLAIDRACRILGRASVGVTQEAMDALVGYGWPGNVRELELVLQLAVDASSGEAVDVVHLPPLAGTPEPALPTESLGGTLADVERRALERALEKARGNKTVAAKSLGLARTTFLDKLRRYGLEPGIDG